ncbi:polysaccharide deacetylase family protein [Haloferax namakaokahaiae]|uniref:Polysaccharide deacetylase family protein n=1 Tax=Haloferax namakaokahaiae TaxID=1748331 RepID=A0ABD5ZJA2_9EURY
MSDFAVLLTHDVDRPYKTYQGLYYGLKERSPYHLKTFLLRQNPYWQFEEIVQLERELGVRSSFYFLNEPSLLRTGGLEAWTKPKNWLEHFGRYDITDEQLVDVIRDLDDDGWEVGMHGSFRSSDDYRKLKAEKAALEDVLGHDILGGRQHHMKLGPRTWEYHRDIGLRYDASLGSSRTYGFEHGYQPIRPFDDSFTVFPLTLMEMALPDPGEHYDDAWAVCEELLVEAKENDAVMTVLWHPRYFNEVEFPGYRRLYCELIEWALANGAWVGPVGDYYEQFLLDEAPESAVISASYSQNQHSNGRM